MTQSTFLPSPFKAARRVSSRIRFAFGLMLLALALGLSSPTAQAQSYTLHSFHTTTGDGASPDARLLNVNGILYGTTFTGGPNNRGTIFSIDPTTNTETTLYSFIGGTDGAAPEASLLNINGTLYGTTSSGGAGVKGTVFSINTDGTNEKVLYSFAATNSSDGVNPITELTNINGTLYGTTNGGGVSYHGTVFSINTDGTGYRILHQFAQADGYAPSSGLLNVNGVLYGTTYFGGASNQGAVFSINIDGTGFQTLYSFTGQSDGRFPEGGLIAIGGVLYGTTFRGGTVGQGAIFSFDTATNTEQTLYSFGDIPPNSEGIQDGYLPNTSLVNVNGVLYGTTTTSGTNNDGIVFSFDLATQTEKTIFNFGDITNIGSTPQAGMIDVNGTLYGTTSEGGINNDGTVFRLDVPPIAPIANDDAYTGSYEETIGGDGQSVFSNDDASGGTLSATIITQPSHGTLRVSTSGSYTFLKTGTFLYTPNAGFTGTDTFTYQDSNSFGTSNIATVTLTVMPVKPKANGDAASMKYNTGITVPAPGVLSNDDDGGREPLTPTLVRNVTHGILVFNSDGSYSYTPNTGFIGTDTFTYQDTTSIGQSNVATVALRVAAPIPVAHDDSCTINYNTTRTNPAPGVLANDEDKGDGPLTATLVTNVSHGTLTLSSNGAFTYTPKTGYIGTDTFTYRVSNPLYQGSTATVTLTVQAVLPIAHNDVCTVNYNTTRTNPAPGVLFNDFDGGSRPLTAILVSNVSHGTLTLGSDGSFTYTPNTGYAGTDTFTYQVANAVGKGTIGTVALTVLSTAPTAHDDACTVVYNKTRINAAPGVLANDNNGGAGSMTAALVSNVSHGSLTLNSDGSFAYTPTTGYVGTDSFTYQAVTSAGTSNIATVTLTVIPTTPTARNDGATILHNTGRFFATPGVLSNDDNGGDGPITATLIHATQHGTVSLGSDGSFSYAPFTGYSGTDTFTYQIANSIGEGNIATVTLTVQ